MFGVVVAWLALVTGVGWWMSEQTIATHMARIAESSAYEAKTTARIMDRLFAEMTSVANMVAHQAQVIQLAGRYRSDPASAAHLTREQRAARFTRDPLVRSVGSFMNALSSDLGYARIYMNNLSDDTVTASNWDESGSIVGMVYSGRPYLMDALRTGNGHSFGIARLNGSPSYFVTSRIEDAAGSPLGSATVKFDAPDMALYLRGQHISLIVNSQGRVTTSSSPPFMLRNVAPLLPPAALRSSNDEAPGSPMAIHRLADEGVPDRWLIDGKSYLVQRQPLVNTQYHLLTLAELDHLAPLRREHVMAAVLVALFGLALILLSGQVVGQMELRGQEERKAAMHTAAQNKSLSAALTYARAKERQKVEVLGYVGHDLRAPLATIIGYSRLLLAEASEEQRTLLHTIQRNVKYQLSLIDELLEYAKAELQPLAVEPAAIDLVELLDDIFDYATALCSQQNNRFRYQCSERLPRQVRLDGKRLQQVLLNLLSNAAKFTRDGTVTLSAAAKPAGDTCQLHFSVSDTGIGIELSEGIDIFGAFQQIQAASGGTGLGLFIAQRIISAMGGSLRAASAPGRGSTFSFELPAPIIGAPDSAWSAVVPRTATPAENWAASSVDHDAIPADRALDELAGFALQGRLTEIERWIERHGDDAALAPFIASLRELLQRFDFAGIHALTLRGKQHASLSAGPR